MKRLPKRLTVAWARRHSACPEAVERFARLFPGGLDLQDAKQVKRAWKAFSPDDQLWFLEEITGPQEEFHICIVNPLCDDAIQRQPGGALGLARSLGLPL